MGQGPGPAFPAWGGLVRLPGDALLPPPFLGCSSVRAGRRFRACLGACARIRPPARPGRPRASRGACGASRCPPGWRDWPLPRPRPPHISASRPAFREAERYRAGTPYGCCRSPDQIPRGSGCSDSGHCGACGTSTGHSLPAQSSTPPVVTARRHWVLRVGALPTKQLAGTCFARVPGTRGLPGPHFSGSTGGVRYGPYFVQVAATWGGIVSRRRVHCAGAVGAGPDPG